VVDFEMSIAMPTNSQLARAPDLISIPLMASALVPAYHVRALSERLVYITEIWCGSDLVAWPAGIGTQCHPAAGFQLRSDGGHHVQ
jgi:hypothetical protein